MAIGKEIRTKIKSVQSVTDGEGYEYNFAPNQTLVIPTVAGNIAMSANATVSYGQGTAQLSAPNINIDAGEGTVPIV